MSVSAPAPHVWKDVNTPRGFSLLPQIDHPYSPPSNKSSKSPLAGLFSSTEITPAHDPPQLGLVRRNQIALILLPHKLLLSHFHIYLTCFPHPFFKIWFVAFLHTTPHSPFHTEIQDTFIPFWWTRYRHRKWDVLAVKIKALLFRAHQAPQLNGCDLCLKSCNQR